MPMRDCGFLSWSSGAPPGVFLSVPYYQQDSQYYCLEATIQMWSAYSEGGLFWTQDQIYDQMYTLDPGEVGPNGSSSAAAADGVSALITPATFTAYGDWRQSIADQQKGINNGYPTIAIVNNGYHADLVMGASWHQLGTLQPSDDFVWVHDPDPNVGGAQIGHSVADWTNVADACLSSSDPCWQSIQVSGQASSAEDELSTFDEWGGTYYGADDPPDGCDSCNPDAQPNAIMSVLKDAWSLLRHPSSQRFGNASASVSGTGLSTSRRATAGTPGRRAAQSPERASHGVRKFLYVPNPNSVVEGDVIRNFEAAVRQTQVATRLGWADLDPDHGHTKVSSVEHVESLDAGYPSYYLLTITGEDGSPFALANVSEVGWLQSIALIAGTTVVPKDVEWAKQTLASMGTFDNLHRVYFRSTLSSQSVLPLFEAESGGRSIFLTPSGEVFEQNVNGADGGATFGEEKMRMRRLR